MQVVCAVVFFAPFMGRIVKMSGVVAQVLVAGCSRCESEVSFGKKKGFRLVWSERKRR